MQMGTWSESRQGARCYRGKGSFVVLAGGLGGGWSGGQAALADGSAARGIACAVDQAVSLGVAKHDLNVFARFTERDGFDKFGDFVVVAFGAPSGDAVFTGIESGKSVFGFAGGAKQAGDIKHAKLDVVIRVHELGFGVAYAKLACKETACFGEDLHEADGVGVRDGIGLESDSWRMRPAASMGSKPLRAASRRRAAS